ncbi:MAG: spermidine synthase [Pseudomonadota bacterium]
MKSGRGALLFIFTLSGFSGLIYESIWSHYLKLFLGHAAYSQSLVLTIFMGGMALGAFLAARMSTRLRNLLLAYAIVEALTGAIALVFHPIYVGSTSFAFDVAIPAFATPWSINSFKWGLAALLILPQSVLLGATFPFISGGVIRRFPQNPGATLAMLYFTNSLGAALGVLVSGFWLIGWIGLPGTVTAAGIINLLLAVVVWWLARSQSESAAVTTLAAATQLPQTSLLTRRILLAAFLAGAAAFVYEIAWIRMLSLVLGSSTHAFELMLSAFIFGLAFGGLWIRGRIDRLAAPLSALAIMFAVMAILAALTLPAYGYTFDAVATAMSMFDDTDAGYVGFNLVNHSIAAAIMIPTTFVAGMTLPLMTSTLLRVGDERVIGKVYAANTIGAIFGVTVAVHLLLPLAGIKGTILIGALVQLATAAMLAPRAMSAPGLTRTSSVLAAGVFCVAGVALLVKLDPMRMASGVYRAGLARLPDGARVTYLRDGKTASISLTQLGDTVVISTNGKPDAAINMGAPDQPGSDEITMTLLGVLPLAMSTHPRLIANIGVGSGLTSQVILGDPRVLSLDSIEIEPAMVEAAHLGFGPRVFRLFEDPRSHIRFEDAKTFFAATRNEYDIIISEPSNPWVSGVASLFSSEFYAQVSRHLADDGLLVQWIQIYETDVTIIASIVKAMSPYFADYAVFNTDDTNILIVASRHGSVPRLDPRALDTPELAADLHRVGINNIGDIELRRIGNRRLLGPLFAAFDVPANSDYYPYVDQTANRMRFLSRNALPLTQLGLLGIPLAEIFGVPLQVNPSDSPNSARYFERHRLASEALGILAAMKSRELAAAPANARRDLLSLDLPAAACDSAETRGVWLDAVHSLAARTTPFVPLETRAAWWPRVESSACFGKLDALERNWVLLLAAMSGGDPAATATNGTKLLAEPPASMSGNQLIEVLLATTAAQTATGQPEAAIGLLNSYLPSLQNPGRYSLALELLRSMLTAPSVPAAPDDRS